MPAFPLNIVPRTSVERVGAGKGVSFGDLQVRAYVTSLSAEDVLLRVRTQGFRAAQNIAEGQDGFAAGGKAMFSISTEQGWHHGTIRDPCGMATTAEQPQSTST